MGRDAGFAQVGNEPTRVIPLVGAQRQLPGRSGGLAMNHLQGSLTFGMTICLRQVALHDQPVAVLHQRMSDETQHGSSAGGFLVEPRIGVGRRGMGGIRALLAPEIDLGIAVGSGVAGHRVDLGRGLGKRGFGRGIRGRRIAWPVLVRRGGLGLRLETLHRGPGFHQRAIDREVVIRHERCHLAMGQDRRQHLARHLGGQQPVAVPGEYRGPPAWGFARSGLNWSTGPIPGRPSPQTGSSMPRPTNQRNIRL